jgi:hypothetical protein
MSVPRGVERDAETAMLFEQSVRAPWQKSYVGQTLLYSNGAQGLKHNVQLWQDQLVRNLPENWDVAWMGNGADVEMCVADHLYDISPCLRDEDFSIPLEAIKEYKKSGPTSAGFGTACSKVRTAP